jgi:hypothetical protein
MKSALQERVPRPTGSLAYTITHRDHGVIKHVVDNNLVLTNIADILANLIIGTTTNRFLDYIAIGNVSTATALTDDSIGEILTTDLVDGENEHSAVFTAYRKDITSLSASTPGEAVATFSIGYSEANTLGIREWGLLTTSGVMVARKVTSLITKSSDISIAGTWTLLF